MFVEVLVSKTQNARLTADVPPSIFAESGPSGPVGSLQHYCASVCLSVSSINA